MATIAFGAHKFVRRLQEAGLEEKQAEAISEALQGSLRVKRELATKRDIERLEARFEKLETKLGVMDGSTDDPGKDPRGAPDLALCGTSST